MTTVPPSRDEDERPLFADPASAGRPFDAPVVRRPRQARPAPPFAPSPPPVMAAPSPKATAPAAPAGPAHKRLMVGQVNGQVSVTSKVQHFYGVPILVVVLVSAVAAVCLYAAGSLLAVLLITLVVLTVLLSFAMRPVMALVLGVMRLLVRLVSSLLIRVTLLGGRAVRGTVNNVNLQQALTVRRFQVQLISGQYLTCLMYGDLSGDEPAKGDHVAISGRRRKDRCVVRSIHVFAARGGAVVRKVHARRPLGLRILRLVDVVSYLLAALALAGLIALVTGAGGAGEVAG